MLYKYKTSDFNTSGNFSSALNVTQLVPSSSSARIQQRSPRPPPPRHAHTARSRDVNPPFLAVEDTQSIRPVSAPLSATGGSTTGKEKNIGIDGTVPFVRNLQEEIVPRRPQTALPERSRPSPTRSRLVQSATVEKMRSRELSRSKSMLASGHIGGEVTDNYTSQSPQPPVKDYDDELKKHGWRMEVHGDPLNLKLVC